MSVVKVVVGAAFGSEGKGHITAQLVKTDIRAGLDVLNIRVAGPNAGHTVIDNEGQSFALRAVPVGAVYHETRLYIAPGSEVDLPVLVAEINLLRSMGHPLDFLGVSGEATILTDEHRDIEANVGLTARVGSTGKGIGAARQERLMRTAKRVKDDPEVVQTLIDLGVRVINDDEEFIDQWLQQQGTSVVVEGTQGYGLGLHAGFYPQTTSSDCRAIDFLAMAGISPWHAGVRHTDVWLVARVFPIRVAGNSGPLKGETSWEDLKLPEERTTVTRKVRRVGEWDGELVRRAVRANGGGQTRTGVAVRIALTMVDQKFAGVKDMTNLPGYIKTADASEREAFFEFCKNIEAETGARIGIVSTSDRTIMRSGAGAR